MSAIIKAFPPSRMVGRAKATAQVWLTKNRQAQRQHNLREMAEMTAAMELAGMGPYAIKQQLFAFNRLACDEFCRVSQQNTCPGFVPSAHQGEEIQA